MATHETIVHKRYFDWMVRLVCDKRYTRGRSWQLMLYCLHQWDFVYHMAMDENREWDGIDLRSRFEQETGWNAAEMEGDKCSVLEMMLALAIRCEEHIMANPDAGDRTGEWFWTMIDSLGLNMMDDAHFDEAYFNGVIERFLNREYAPNGKGGLFIVERGNCDMRKVEIWYQMMWYLDSIM